MHGRAVVRNLGAVSPLRLALRATSPVSGRLTVASLLKVGNLFCVQTEVPTRKADSRGRLSLQKINCARGAGRVMEIVPTLGHGIAVEVENYTISLNA